MRTAWRRAAPGFAASQLYFLQGDGGAAAELRIELRGAGGTVTGLVVDGTGASVRGALVRVGEGRSNNVRSTPAGAEPLPAVARTAIDGSFTAFGVAAGTVPVQVVARGCAPWLGTVELAPGASVALRVELQAGAACVGIARGVDEQAVAGARVDVGTRDDLWAQETLTDAEGRFALRGLPPGEVEVRAATPRVGKAATRFVGRPGSTTTIELRLDRGRVLTVRVVDEQGEPVPFATAEVAAEGAGVPWSQYGHSDREGRFELAEWPVDRVLSIEVRKRGHLTARHQHAALGPASFTVQLPRDARPAAQILGRILRPDGSPATGLDVDAMCDEPRQEAGAVTAADGSFTLAVPEGSWRLRVAAAGHPEVRLGPTELLAGQPWQVGTVQLTVGGTLHVELPTELADAGTVFTAAGVFVSGLVAPVPPLRSTLLAPGDYVLQLQPVGRAVLALPFVIRASATTTLRPELVAGVEQRIEFAAAGEPLGSVEFELRRDGARLLIERASDGTPQRRTAVPWLAPGRYEVVTRGYEHAVRAEFVVGAEAGGAVVVTLR